MTAYEQLINLIKKLPFGSSFLERGSFLSFEYLLWIVLALIVIIGVSRNREFRDIRANAGCFLLLLAIGLLAIFFLKRFLSH